MRHFENSGLDLGTTPDSARLGGQRQQRSAWSATCRSRCRFSLFPGTVAKTTHYQRDRRCFVKMRRGTRPMVCFVNVESASADHIIYSIFQRFNLDWEPAPSPYLHKQLDSETVNRTTRAATMNYA